MRPIYYFAFCSAFQSLLNLAAGEIISTAVPVTVMHQGVDMKHDFQCETETAVHLPADRLCDGKNDCPFDNSDETLEICLEHNKCPPGQKRCSSLKQCVATNKICDGNDDCSNGWDESEMAGCSKHLSKNFTESCPDDGDYFTCSDSFHRCVPKSAKCDFRRDCEGGEDESDCPDGRHCPGEMFHCSRTAAAATPSDAVHNNFFDNCIEMARHCNGIEDCPDGEDELHCYSHDDHHMDKPGEEHEVEVHGDAMKIGNSSQQLVLSSNLLLFLSLPALISFF